MRKIVAGMMVSVDGVVEAPEAWTGPYFSPDLGQWSRGYSGCQSVFAPQRTRQG
jgi:hypothetical protein